MKRGRKQTTGEIRCWRYSVWPLASSSILRMEVSIGRIVGLEVKRSHRISSILTVGDFEQQFGPRRSWLKLIFFSFKLYGREKYDHWKGVEANADNSRFLLRPEKTCRMLTCSREYSWPMVTEKRRQFFTWPRLCQRGARFGSQSTGQSDDHTTTLVTWNRASSDMTMKYTGDPIDSEDIYSSPSAPNSRKHTLDRWLVTHRSITDRTLD